MSRSIITVEVKHHGATKALSRILALLDFCKDAYGVESLTYNVDTED